jgi:hypothetical protein
MNPLQEGHVLETRRQFFARGKNALGYAALTSLLGSRLRLWAEDASPTRPVLPHFAPKAKRVLYLHMVGGPSQMDLFDHKPVMNDWYDKDLPDSIRMGQRLTTMTSGQTRFPIAPSKYKFARHGQMRPVDEHRTAPLDRPSVDDLCFIRSMHTEAINHEPAITHMQTGNQIGGRPCLGSWVGYGLGSINANLPTFVVLVAEPRTRNSSRPSPPASGPAAISPANTPASRSAARATRFSSSTIPDPAFRPNSAAANSTAPPPQRSHLSAVGDPETHTRIQQFEMAFRMQASVPELMEVKNEPESTYKLYGDEARKPGTFAYTALLARRLVERGVRFVQVYHNNWDHHANTRRTHAVPVQGRRPTRLRPDPGPQARGLFDDTLIIWGGEFGRTIYSQGGLSKDNYGRDHHPRCFTMWMAGGGAKPGTVHGETDDFSYNIVKDPVHVRDFHATILHLLGIDHQRFTFKYQGLDGRLTGVEPARVVKELLA